MAIEIERKFLLSGDGWQNAVVRSIFMRQNYLSRLPTVRVRIAGDQAFLTIKSRVRNRSRSEYEYPIPLQDAEEMLNTLCAGYEVCKTRYIVLFAGKTWEIDVFEGLNAGLVMAEIELADPAEHFEMPPWIGREVTADKNYYNGSLAQTPWTMRQPSGAGE